MKQSLANSKSNDRIFLTIGWTLLIFLAYGRLLLHPQLHIACPENDTWNFPIRWSVLSSLQGGHLPLWNPLSCFGIPWLATWQTETFYPGTLLYWWKGLGVWNLGSVLHLLILSLGVYTFLKKNNVQTFWAFTIAGLSLMNGCAYNHLGSNSSMDTMAWVPWVFISIQAFAEKEMFGGTKLALFLALQIFAGYPQIIFYTLFCGTVHFIYLKGFEALPRLVLPILAALAVSACQWIPSVEYFFLNSARLPAVRDNPDFILPLENLKTFFQFNALGKPGIPDYVASPTFFYFNFYSGILPLFLILMGVILWKKTKNLTRFFLVVFFALVLWALGLGSILAYFLHIPFPSFLEPAKSWVVLNFFELFTQGLLLQDLFPKPRVWKWAFLILAFADLLFAVRSHPLETNLLPPNTQLAGEAQKFKNHLSEGRVLILPSEQVHQTLYTPLPGNEKEARYKHFIPDSNLFVGLPLANFYGSTWPSWGALDAQFYFYRGFPYEQGGLMDLLGVDLLYITETKMPKRFEKIGQDGAWGLWKNPHSLGSHFFFYGQTKMAQRKEIFQAFTTGLSHPLDDLYMEPRPISNAPIRAIVNEDSQGISYSLPENTDGVLVVTQNAVPGWRAWIDGKPSDLYLADGIFQGLTFKKGSKMAIFRYEPASFRLGLFISLVGLMGLLTLAGLGRKTLH